VQHGATLNSAGIHQRVIVRFRDEGDGRGLRPAADRSRAL
jgi:hypothetical protein